MDDSSPEYFDTALDWKSLNAKDELKDCSRLEVVERQRWAKSKRIRERKGNARENGETAY